MKSPEDTTSGQARVRYTQPAADSLLIRLAGGWSLKEGIPSIDEFNQQITDQPLIRQIRFDGRDITQWDTSLLAFLTRILGQARQKDMASDLEGLPGASAACWIWLQRYPRSRTRAVAKNTPTCWPGSAPAR
jgi:ABC-type transporter Mla MlaB component